jgi:GTP-binding nuclear protein Ran
MICGDSADSKERKVMPKHITFPRDHGLPYHEISVTHCGHLEALVLWLCRELLGDPDLSLARGPPPEPVANETQ